MVIKVLDPGDVEHLQATSRSEIEASDVLKILVVFNVILDQVVEKSQTEAGRYRCRQAAKLGAKVTLRWEHLRERRKDGQADQISEHTFTEKEKSLAPACNVLDLARILSVATADWFGA